MSSTEDIVSTSPVALPATRRRISRGWALVVIVALVGLGAWTWRAVQVRSATAQTSPPSQRAAGGPPGAANGPRPVVVRAAKTTLQDVDIVLNGLGTVVPRRSVQLRSRVTGQLARVNFKEGDLVQQGQLLALIDPRPFEAEVQRVKGQLTRDEALLAHARADFARSQALKEALIANQEEVDLKNSLVKQYEGVLQTNRGVLTQAALQLEYTRIVAPFAGRIGLRSLDAGNNVGPNDPVPIATIHSVQPIDVMFALPEDHLTSIAGRFHAKNVATSPLAVEAWDKGSRRLIATGRLVALDNQVDSNTGTFKLKAEFSNEDGLLYPNQFVNVRLLVETLAKSVVVPRSAVQHGTNGPYVFALDDANVARVRSIQLGVSNGGVVAVQAGLAEGELVVTSGLDRLREGVSTNPLIEELPREKKAEEPSRELEARTP